MQIPRWKHWLSYLWEIHIESAYSEYSEDLYVTLKRGRFQLCTANAIYSFEDLYLNFSRAIDQVEIHKTKDLNVLILGLGMGSIPMVMESKDFANCHFTAIEIDEAIIDIFSRYGADRINSPIEVYQANAISYVAIAQEKFDIIAIDIFINDIVPNEVQSQEFLDNVKQRLAKDGIVMMNHLSLKKKDKVIAQRFFDEIFKPIFPQADYIDVSGNWMFINEAERICR